MMNFSEISALCIVAQQGKNYSESLSLIEQFGSLSKEADDVLRALCGEEGCSDLAKSKAANIKRWVAELS